MAHKENAKTLTPVETNIITTLSFLICSKNPFVFGKETYLFFPEKAFSPHSLSPTNLGI